MDCSGYRKKIGLTLLLYLVLGGWPGAAESAADMLERITPDFPAPLLQAGDSAAALRLVGVDLHQSGQPLSVDHPVVAPGQLLTVTTYWESSTAVSEGAPLALKFWAHNGMITRSFDVDAGPPAGETWEPGGVYRQAHSLDPAAVASAFSGNVRLTLNHRLGEGRLAPLQALALRLKPHVRARQVSSMHYRAFLGPRHHSLDCAFRLGAEAEAAIPIPRNRGRNVRAIGVISAFSYGTAAQGDVVCELFASGTEGPPLRLPIESGVSTARGDYDFYPKERNAHRKIAVIESKDADYLSATGAPFEKHKYVARLELPEGFGDLAELRLRSTSSVILDILDLVLCYGDGPAVPDTEAAP